MHGLAPAPQYPEVNMLAALPGQPVDNLSTKRKPSLALCETFSGSEISSLVQPRSTARHCTRRCTDNRDLGVTSQCTKNLRGPHAWLVDIIIPIRLKRVRDRFTEIRITER